MIIQSRLLLTSGFMCSSFKKHLSPLPPRTLLSDPRMTAALETDFLPSLLFPPLK